MKNILITGSTGLLGKSLSEAFENRGLNLLTPPRSILDLKQTISVEKYFQRNHVDCVIHCAAKVGGIRANLQNPSQFIFDNLRMDLNLLEACSSKMVKEFIFFGSSCMYPRITNQPMNESQILTGKLEPTNESYAMAKLATAEMVRSIAISRGWSYRTIVLSNLYGQGEREDPPNSHLVGAIHHKFREAILSGSLEIEVWGTGKVRREFTHVLDVASWLAENVSRVSEFPIIMNLGYGIDYSVEEYYEFFSNAYSGEFKFKFNLKKPEGMPAKLLDSSMAKKYFNWSPMISPERGIRELVNLQLKGKEESSV